MDIIGISPDELAQNAKDELFTVSIRVKPSTWYGFEKIAREHKTTSPALIAKMADMYIENLGDNLQDDDTAILRQRAEDSFRKAALRCAELSDDDILREDGFIFDETDAQPTEFYLRTVKAGLRPVNERHQLGYSAVGDFSGSTLIEPITGQRAKFYPSIMGGLHGSSSYSYLEVPLSKWVLVQHLLDAEFRKYCKNLGSTPDLSYGVMESIVRLINSEKSSDRRLFATSLVAIILEN